MSVRAHSERGLVHVCVARAQTFHGPSLIPSLDLDSVNIHELSSGAAG